MFALADKLAAPKAGEPNPFVDRASFSAGPNRASSVKHRVAPAPLATAGADGHID
jgi:hypothetical protein